SCQNGPNIHIGHHFLAGSGLMIIDAAEVRIGNYVTMGPDCLLTTQAHPRSTSQRRQRLARAEAIELGNDVCLGARVTVLAGVRIGDNVIVEAGAVVDHDLPANGVFAGNPARKIADLENDCE
ncbi:DapH/DapD/GlmU-related protein, partial [Lactobacillus nasalidis]